MLADWLNEPAETAVNKIEAFEKSVKQKLIKEPGQMKLIIVVDKLLTGFNGQCTSYLYIDKQMRDHDPFQAICRVNRLDGDDKEFGYIIDYKDLFKSIESAVDDYTSGALDGFDKEDVAGLLEEGLRKGVNAWSRRWKLCVPFVRPWSHPKINPPTCFTFPPRSRGMLLSSRPTSRSACPLSPDGLFDPSLCGHRRRDGEGWIQRG